MLDGHLLVDAHVHVPKLDSLAPAWVDWARQFGRPGILEQIWGSDGTPDPAAGLLFRGRIAEDFKLSTGTFVSVGTLRPRLLSASQGLLTDAVICGENGDHVTAMVWLSADAAQRLDDDGVPDESLRSELVATMQRLAAEGGGSSQCVERLLVLREPAGLDAGEITDKGYVNQRAVRERRSDDVVLLSAEPPAARVVVRENPAHA